jgi:hypothetical protein
MYAMMLCKAHDGMLCDFTYLDGTPAVDEKPRPIETYSELVWDKDELGVWSIRIDPPKKEVA